MQLIGFMGLFWRWWTKIKKFSLIRPKLCLPALLGKKKVIILSVRWLGGSRTGCASLVPCFSAVKISGLGWKTPKQCFSVLHIAFVAQRLNIPTSFPEDNLGSICESSLWSFFLGKRFWWSQGWDVSRRVKSGWEAQLAGKSRWLLKVKLRHLPRVSLHELLQFDTGMFSQAAGFFRKQIRNPFSTEKLRKICGRFSSSHNRKEHFW